MTKHEDTTQETAVGPRLDAPVRPGCFEFAMDFLGGPEDAIVRAYVDALEAFARDAVVAERERPRHVLAYMATSREGNVRFTDNPDAARELAGYGWAITPLADAGPNGRANPAAEGSPAQRSGA